MDDHELQHGQTGFGVMQPNLYPHPDDESKWQELLDAAESEGERGELVAARERHRRSWEHFAQWERDHPRSWWHRLLIRIAPR